jgi:hypothetical protein
VSKPGAAERDYFRHLHERMAEGSIRSIINERPAEELHHPLCDILAADALELFPLSMGKYDILKVVTWRSLGEACMDQVTAALVGAAASVVVSIIGYWVQRAKFRDDFRHDIGQARTGFMAETVVQELLTQPNIGPWRTFVMIRHHVGGFADDDLRKILVRAGAIRFRSPSGKELWALYDHVRNYQATWDKEPTNYLSHWRVPAEPDTPPESELFPVLKSGAPFVAQA